MSPLSRNTKVWLHGLVAGFISGGANGFVGSGFASVLAPDSFNLKTGIWKMLTLFVGTFIFSGFMGAMAYLKQSPIPVEADVPSGPVDPKA